MTVAQQMQSAELQKRFHGKKQAESKYIPKFPESAERDYIRMMAGLTQQTKISLERHLPELMAILAENTQEGINKLHMDAKSPQKKKNQERRKLARFETLDNTIVRLKRVFATIEREIAETFKLFNLKRKLTEIANANRKLTIKEWKKAIGKTLGINILDDYYDGSFYGDILDKWVEENVNLIVCIPKDTLGRMQEIILRDYLDGVPITTITKNIQRDYQVTKSHARLLARDQMGKLNAKVTKYQQTSAGVKEYIWRTAGDGRVRKDHKALNKKKFRWDSPPIVDKRTGRRAHPGEDYQCRCIAVPVFDFDNLDIPADGRREVKK